MINLKQKYYLLSTKEVFDIFETNEKGLSVDQVSSRQTLYGKNVLISVHKQSEIIKFLSQFNDSFMYLLIASGSVAWYLKDLNTTVILGIIILINAVIGYLQESKAERTMEKLKSIVSPKAEVMRDGERKEIPSSELVIGDVVFLEEGDAVPADLRIFQTTNLGTNDFSLTGESNPVKKFVYPLKGETEVGDRNNQVYMGTTVAMGSGWGIVVATGMNTELGRIAKLSAESEHDISPLQKELKDISIKTIYIVCFLVIGLVITTLWLDFTLYESFLFALGIGAAMVPQGLPTQLNIGLSLASGRLAQKNTIVKKLSSVETMGATNIICTDKTGTLTKNEMTVQKVFLGNKLLNVEGVGYKPEGEITFENGERFDQKDVMCHVKFFQAGMFASNARLNHPDNEHSSRYVLGDPTEGALITLSKKVGFDQEILNKRYKEIQEYSFDSERKRMSSVRLIDGKYFLFVKGAPDSILSQSSQYRDGSQERMITDQDSKTIQQYDNEWANDAMRVMAYAYKEIPNYQKDLSMDEAEKDLVFLGLVGMIDPPRDDVRDAMIAAHEAHIKVIMITGDYALTAQSIAKRIQLAPPGSTFKNITGAELKMMSDGELKKVLSEPYLLFSRSSPEDKLRIIKLIKSSSDVIAVTGDGINDAPALKEADIGVAMGIVGTEVAKEASEMILLNDSFTTLVSAIKEGRTIYQNIKKNILACFTTNYTELFIVMISLLGKGLFGMPMAISAIQILAIDLIGEMLPLAAMTRDPPKDNLMKKPPRNINDHIFTGENMGDFITWGVVMGAVAYLAFLLAGIEYGEWGTENLSMMTVTYITIILCQYVNIMSYRAGINQTMFTDYFRTNPKMFWAIGSSLFIVLNLIYNPWINHYFGFSPISWIDRMICFCGMIVYLGLREGYKYVKRKSFSGEVSN